MPGVHREKYHAQRNFCLWLFYIRVLRYKLNAGQNKKQTKQKLSRRCQTEQGKMESDLAYPVPLQSFSHSKSPPNCSTVFSGGGGLRTPLNMELAHSLTSPHISLKYTAISLSEIIMWHSAYPPTNILYPFSANLFFHWKNMYSGGTWRRPSPEDRRACLAAANITNHGTGARLYHVHYKTAVPNRYSLFLQGTVQCL